jgi:hypothetical protein
MPSRSGKSLTAFRFANLDYTLLLGGDTTAESFRKKLHSLYKANQLENLRFIIVEDWSKIREKVKEGFCAVLSMFAMRMLTIDQTKMNIATTKVHASILINVPSPFLNDLIKNLQNVGAGDRFKIIEMKLSEEKKKELDRLGIINADKRLYEIEINHFEKKIDFETFYDNFTGEISDLNFAYIAHHIRDSLYDELKKACRSEIKEISWDGYWEEE